ncbi:hypothetical protein [Deinococcus sp. JMULE3]|uniref:hypothetical protein n=1 Tax=Deinococcus sp. JMULE3 TaxID=2518341 RepID=UPI0035305260
MKVFPLLLCSVLLCGCQDREARAQNAALQARVTELEAQVKALQGEQETALPADAQSVTVRAAGQTCANALTRTLEVFRQDSLDDRYPSAAQTQLPAECVDLRVNWVARSERAYTFTVTDASGRELARQSGGATPPAPVSGG